MLQVNEMNQISTERGTRGDVRIGNYLYKLELENRLLIFDVSNPAYPELVWDIDGFFGYDMALSGDYLFTVGGGGMWVIDVSNPAVPTVLLTYTEFDWENGYPPSVSSIGIKDNYAYLTVTYGVSYITHFGYVKVLDISDPLNPSEVYSMGPGLGRYDDMVIYGINAYYSVHERFYILDLTVPDDPVRVGLGSEDWFIRQLLIADGRLFVETDEGSWSVFNLKPITRYTILEPAIQSDEELSLRAYADGYLYTWEFFAGFEVRTDPYFETVIPLADDMIVAGVYGQEGFIHIDDAGLETWESGLVTLRMSAVSERVEPGVAESLVYTDTAGLVTTVEIGAGAVLSSTEVSYLPLNAVDQTPGRLFTPHAFSLAGHMPDDRLTLTEFAEPVTVTLPFTTTQFPLGWQFVFWDETKWVPVEETCSMVNGDQFSVDSNQFSVDSNQFSVFSDQPPATSYQLPATSYQQPATNNQPPVTNSQRPTANGQLQFTICLPGKYALFSQPYETFFPIAPE